MRTLFEFGVAKVETSMYAMGSTSPISLVGQLYGKIDIVDGDFIDVTFKLSKNPLVSCITKYNQCIQDDPVDVIRAIKRGFDRGEKDFGVKARSILCAIRGLDQYTDAIFALGNHHISSYNSYPTSIIARDHKDLGVVAIDVAGSAHGADEQYEPNVVEIFKVTTFLAFLTTP